MRNFSITNLEQSKRLFYAGLNISTADYIIQRKISKVSSVVNVEELPIRIDVPSDLKKAEDNDSFSAAWSLGKLVQMMPEIISSQYDENGYDIGDDSNCDFHLILEKNRVLYRNGNDICHFTTHGSCLIEAVVEMIVELLKNEYTLNNDDEE